MNPHALRLVPLAAILAAVAFRAGAAAAADQAPLPAAASPDGTVAEAAAIPGPQDEAAIGDAAGAAHAHTGAVPASRLLQSLGVRAAQPPRSQESGEDRGADPVSVAAGMQVAGVLHGCPRALLGALLAGAADSADSVSALAIERETLALCRERQEIVNGIVALEVELGALLAEAQNADAGAPSPVANAAAVEIPTTPTVKDSAPVRVVSLPPADDDAGEAAEEKPESVPAPPAYAWFSIIGSAGDLRAGVRSLGDGRVWFVREGDRLPGGVMVMHIVARPPGVHVGGAFEAALPYRSLGTGATAAASSQRVGEGP